jgi:hypothetical protein
MQNDRQSVTKLQWHRHKTSSDMERIDRRKNEEVQRQIGNENHDEAFAYQNIAVDDHADWSEQLAIEAPPLSRHKNQGNPDLKARRGL